MVRFTTELALLGSLNQAMRGQFQIRLSAPAPSFGVHCTSTGMGGTVSTNCY